MLNFLKKRRSPETKKTGIPVEDLEDERKKCINKIMHYVPMEWDNEDEGKFLIDDYISGKLSFNFPETEKYWDSFLGKPFHWRPYKEIENNVNVSINEVKKILKQFGRYDLSHDDYRCLPSSIFSLPEVKEINSEYIDLTYSIKDDFLKFFTIFLFTSEGVSAANRSRILSDFIDHYEYECYELWSSKERQDYIDNLLMYGKKLIDYYSYAGGKLRKIAMYEFIEKSLNSIVESVSSDDVDLFTKSLSYIYNKNNIILTTRQSEIVNTLNFMS